MRVQEVSTAAQIQSERRKIRKTRSHSSSYEYKEKREQSQTNREYRGEQEVRAAGNTRGEQGASTAAQIQSERRKIRITRRHSSS